MVKVSVIIPIYKVEPYIERCARSLMEQRLADVEYVFVDDGSPDGSVAVLQGVLADYPERQGQVRIVRHERNRGLPAARNTGMQNATGEYIFHCDSDDYLEPDALEQMAALACREDADWVYSDWLLTHRGHHRYMAQPACKTADEALRAMLHGGMKYNVWNKLVRRRLYEGISFPEGHGMGEDMTMLLVAARARSVAYLPRATYHYVRDNQCAFTATVQPQHNEDLQWNTHRVVTALSGRVDAIDIDCFKLHAKFALLVTGRRADYEWWQSWHPEAHAAIPRHEVSRRMRLIERAAAGGHFWLLRAYHLVVQRMVDRR